MNILNLLANDSFICVNKHIIKELGLYEAIIIGELASMYCYNKNNQTLLDDKWFYATVEKIKNNTGISDHIQKQTIDKLCTLGILQQKLSNMPRRRYLAFDEKKLVELLINTQLPKFGEQASENSDASIRNPGVQASENSDAYIYKNTNNNTIDNNNPMGVYSNKNNTNNIVGKNIKSAPNPPRVSAPHVQSGSKLPNKVKAKLLNLEPQTKKVLQDYCLFLIDTYNLPERSILNRIDDICRKARNVDIAIQAICNYNINGGYKTLFIPSNLSKTVAESVVISEEATQDDFVRDSEGNIEEIW